MLDPNSHSPAPSHQNAAAYWDQVLDPQNLERSAPSQGLSLEAEIAFASTPDFEAAARWLEAAPAQNLYVDLGAGLGAMAFAIARRGHQVLAVDTSLSRLRRLQARAEAAGCAGRIIPLLAAAESLPFADGSIPCLYTKSVLIHTHLPRSAAEIARILAPAARAALIEPQPGNPFASLYRRWFAPKSWAEITQYFTPEIQRLYIDAIEAPQHPHPPSQKVAPFYLFGFLAFGFQFAWPQSRLFRLSLAITQPLDRLLFKLLPPLRRAAWFGVLKLAKPTPSKSASNRQKTPPELS